MCVIIALLMLQGLCPNAFAFNRTKDASTTLTMTVPPPDKTPPAVTIRIGNSQWQEFLSTISFGLLFSDTQTVTVTAEDSESGVDKVWYLVRKTALTVEDIQDASLVWTELDGNTFSVAPYTKAVIYVKASDNKGNIGYYSSDGFIVQKCVVTADSVVLVMDCSTMPDGAKAIIAAYNDQGRLCRCLFGTAAADGWHFDRSIAEAGTHWKCFFIDADNSLLQEAIELAQLYRD